MSDFYLFTIAFAESQILLALAKILSRDSFKKLHNSEILFSVFLFTVGIYLSQPLILIESNPIWLTLIWQHLPTAVPALFLLCCAAIFLDGFELRASYFLSIVIILIPPLIHDLLSLGESFEFLLVSLSQGIEFVLMLGGLLIVAKSWRNDLLESRRRLRIWVMGLAGSIIFIVIFAQQVSTLSEEYIDLLHYPASALLLFVINMFLLQSNQNGILFQVEEASQSVELESTPLPEAVPVQSEAYLQLKQLMEEEKAYLNETLTITELAYGLKLPEYKLRKLINAEMGFRNFNEFLNHYRVTEACEKLLASSESITTIANQVGFNTLSAFNRAFKHSKGLTPSEFRKSAR
jgi:AraC-like DNA-binding protein